MQKKNDQKIKKQIERLASFGLTNKEIAEVLEYNENTLKRNFEIFLTKGRANLKQRLKRKQITVALGGNVVMLIWLGKQYLGQTEKVEEVGDINITLNKRKIEKKLVEELTPDK